MKEYLEREGKLLSETKARFILSTWDHNQYRNSNYIETLRKNFNINNKEHFYHIEAKEKNRNTMIEVIIKNF